LLILALEHTTKFRLLEAIRTLKIKLGDRSLFQTLLGFSFQNCGRDGLISIMAVAMILGELVLLWVNTETLRNEVNVDSLDVLK
jgi:hypothetical protein